MESAESILILNKKQQELLCNSDFYKLLKNGNNNIEITMRGSFDDIPKEKISEIIMNVLKNKKPTK